MTTFKWVLMIGTAVTASSLFTPVMAGGDEKVYLVGQDFGSVRDYYLSQCCARPDGVTTYMSLYALLTPPQYGGLGMDGQGRAVNDADWGAGPINALKSVTGLPIKSLAIGLSLTEEGRKGALADVAKGKYDAEIEQLAVFIKLSRKVVYLRIGYEFDGAWNAGYEKPQDYIAAYRHIVDRLRALGVTHTHYVWQASSSPLDDIIEGRSEDIGQWYPGDDYVDMAGISWFLAPDYQPPVTKSGYKAPTQGQLRDELMTFARAHGKPVMIAELSPQGYDLKALTRANITPMMDGKSGKDKVRLDADAIWQAWYAPLFDWLAQNPDVTGIAYINADWDGQKMWGAPYANGYWGNSRLQDNGEIAKRWNDAVTRWKSDQK